MFAPRRVALVGASDRPGSVGRLLWDNLAGFPGEVVPVGPAGRVGGQVAYPGLRDVPGQVDLAVVATPAATVPGIVRAAAGKGVAAVVVLSAGFAETGERARSCRPRRWPRPGRAACGWSGPTASGCRTPTCR